MLTNTGRIDRVPVTTSTGGALAIVLVVRDADLHPQRLGLYLLTARARARHRRHADADACRCGGCSSAAVSARRPRLAARLGRLRRRGRRHRRLRRDAAVAADGGRNAGAAVIATDAVHLDRHRHRPSSSVFGLAGAVTAQVFAFALLIGIVAFPGRVSRHAPSSSGCRCICIPRSSTRWCWPAAWSW